MTRLERQELRYNRVVARARKHGASVNVGFANKEPLKDVRKKDRIARRVNRVNKAKQNNTLRYDRKSKYISISGGIGIALAIMLTFILVRSVVDENFVFSIFGFIESIANIPTISIQEILSWDFNLPDWLGFIQSISQVISLLFSCLYNVVVIILWFLKFLFIGV